MTESTESNAERLRTILVRAVDGTNEGVDAAAGLLAEDARIWQQGAGWLDKPQKVAAWRSGLGAPMATAIHTVVGSGDAVALEATFTTPSAALVVLVFATFRAGKLATAREYVSAAPPSEAFARDGS
jgi:hypothetical protein